MARQEVTLAGHLLHSKKSFVKYISREFRIPLNNIYLSTNLITKQLQMGPDSLIVKEISGICDSIIKPCAIATDILNDLLFFDSLEMAHLKPNFKAVEVREMINSMVSPFSIQATQEGIQLHFQGDEWFMPEVQDHYVVIDEQKFSMVIRNLVSNALKFTERGGVVGVISSIINGEFTKKLRIEVQNSGFAIREEIRSELFKSRVILKKFDTQSDTDSEDTTKNEHGTGLGLLIAKQVVDLHGGEIGISPNTVKGRNVFYVEIEAKHLDKEKKPPRKQVEVDQSDDDGDYEINSLTETDGSSIFLDKAIKQNIRRFMLIESDGTNQRLLQQFLQFYTDELFVETFADGNSLLKHLSNDLNKLEAFGKHNDVLILGDFASENGWTEIVRELKSDKFNFMGHIVYITNDVDATATVNIVNTHEDGVSKVIYKPYVSLLLESALLDIASAIVSRQGLVLGSIGLRGGSNRIYVSED